MTITRGDRVQITSRSESVEATVLLKQGTRFVVAFKGTFAGYALMMPIERTDQGVYIDFLDQEQVEVERLL